jgi:hypothetical protein
MFAQEESISDGNPTQLSENSGMDGALHALVKVLARQAANEALDASNKTDAEPSGQSAH